MKISAILRQGDTDMAMPATRRQLRVLGQNCTCQLLVTISTLKWNLDPGGLFLALLQVFFCIAVLLAAQNHGIRKH
jgi:hypothetical protein